MSVFALNALLTAHRWIAFPEVWRIALPVPELFVLILLIAAAGYAPGRARATATTAAVGIGSFLIIYSIAEGIFQLIYARPFFPTTDIRYVRGALLLLFPEATALVTALTPAVVILIAGVVTATVYGIVRCARWGGAAPFHRPVATSLVLLVLTTLGLFLRADTPLLAGRVFDGMFVADDFEVVERRTSSSSSQSSSSRSDRLQSDPTIDNASPGESATDYHLPGLKDRDIYAFVLESYGIAIFERDEVAEELLPVLDTAADRLAADGYSIASSFLEAPVFGGLSWLSEATFLTGNIVDRQSRFETLFESNPNTLTGFLGTSANYYNLKAKPGAVHGDWPEGIDVFDFDEMLIAYNDDFEYRGPWFSFVPVPDQFTVWKMHERIERRRSDGTLEDRPLLAYYQLVSSHVPFSHIPEYIEDWTQMGDGSIFHTTDNLSFDNDYYAGTEYVEGFAASIEYVLEVIVEYMTRIVPDDDESIFIIFGDHQPGSVVAGRGASRSVPIHIVSRDPELLRPYLSEHGYVSGIRPDQPYPHSHMADFFPMFMTIAEAIAP